MKILMITHAAGTPEIGPNMRTFYLGRKLVQRGHEVHIVGSGVFHKYHNSPLLNHNRTEFRVVEGINYRWLSTYRYKKRNLQQVINQLDFAFKLWRGMADLVELKPDVVIMSSPPPFAIYAARAIAKKSGAKLIFEVRDLWPEIIEELGNFKKSHPFLRLIGLAVTTAYRSAHGVVSVKPGDLDFIRSNYITKAKLAYIPNGFDHTAVLDEEYSHPVFSEAGFKVVYTGALSNYYAIEHLIIAAEKISNSHPSVKIIIVGEGEDRQEHEKMVREKNLSNVHLLGFLPKKNMLSIIRQGDVAFLGLRDTKANRFGISTNKLYEYMYAKTPIIASYSTDFDVVKESGAGLSIPPEDHEAIVRAIVQLYEMKSVERASMGQKGYDYLMQHHTFEKIADDYLKFIDFI